MRAALIGAAILAAGCTSTMDPTVPLLGEGASPEAASGAGGPGDWLLPGTRWQLAEIDGTPYTARLVAELTADGRVVGEGPCNAFTAPYSGRWPDLTFDAVAATRRTCPEIDAEAAAFAALDRVNRAAVTDDGLILSGPDGGYMVFSRL